MLWTKWRLVMPRRGQPAGRLPELVVRCICQCWWIPGVWRRWREISPLPTSSWSSGLLRFWLFFLFFVGKRTQWVEDLVTSFASFLLAVFCFFSKNWSEPIFLPQFSWGVETQSAFQCPRTFRSLGRILFGSSMSCFSGTVWNWCAWIWPSCSGFWWVPSLSWMSGISACQLDFIMGSEMGDLGRSVDHLKRTAKGWSDFFLFLTISWHMPGCQVHGISVLEQIEAAKCRPELYCIFGLVVGVWWHEPWVELLGTFEKGHLSIKKQISWLRYLTFFQGVKWSGPWMTLIGANSFAIIGPRKMPGARCGVQGGAVCPWTWRIVRKPCRWKIPLHITSWLCGFSLKRIYFE